MYEIILDMPVKPAQKIWHCDWILLTFLLKKCCNLQLLFLTQNHSRHSQQCTNYFTECTARVFSQNGLFGPGHSLVLNVLYLEDWLCASQSLRMRDPEDCAPKWNLPHCCTMFAPSEKKIVLFWIMKYNKHTNCVKLVKFLAKTWQDASARHMWQS